MIPVTLIIIDGLRPDAIRQARCPSLDWLRFNGSTSFKARSVLPCYTLPCHTSVFYSTLPEQHGVLTNQWPTQVVPGRSLFDVIDAAGLKAGAFYNWEPLRDLSRPGCLALSYFRDNADHPAGDQVIADAAAHYLVHDQLHFAFVYLGTLDNVGHARGWLSDEYLRQLERVDRAVGTILSAFGSEGIVIVHSDHGGHDREHGADVPEDMTIPWLMAGPDIRRKHLIERPLSLLDTAPTIARLLHIPPAAEWQGRAVDEAFSSRGQQPHVVVPQPAFALMADRYGGEF